MEFDKLFALSRRAHTSQDDNLKYEIIRANHFLSILMRHCIFLAEKSFIAFSYGYQILYKGVKYLVGWIWLPFAKRNSTDVSYLGTLSEFIAIKRIWEKFVYVSPVHEPFLQMIIKGSSIDNLIIQHHWHTSNNLMTLNKFFVNKAKISLYVFLHKTTNSLTCKNVEIIIHNHFLDTSKCWSE